MRTILGALALLALSTAVEARVVRLEIAVTQPLGAFGPGEFLRTEGRVMGELSPDERIPGLAAATRIAYASPFILIHPKDPASSNGALLFDVANRGRPISHALYNSPRAVPLPVGSFEAGTGFLEARGFSVISAQWELGTGIELPGHPGQDGRTIYAEGVGLAMIRDLTDFLHNALHDDAGTPNPLAGQVNRTLAVGYSQSARLLKTMLIEGFNMVDGRRVFDGMHIQASAGGRAAVLTENAGPQSSSFFTPRFTDPDWRGVHEPPFTWADIMSTATARGEVRPRMLVTNMTTYYFSIRASLARTGPVGTADVPLPPNVRVYDVAGASHERNMAPGCEKQRDTLDWSPVMRSALVNLDAWVGHNRLPPASQLMPLQARPDDPVVLQAPTHLPGATVQVPMRGEDGNFLGGVQLPDVAAPLGVYGQQNMPLSDRSCNLSGSFVPFTLEQVRARFRDRAAYQEAVRAAVRSLLQQRFLLPGDAAVIIDAAATVPGFDPPRK